MEPETDSWKVAMDVFLDNVPTLAIQAPIVRALPSMFSPLAVSRMAPEEVKRIAEESEEIGRHREQLERQLGTLNEGLRTCKQYAKRMQTCN